MVTVESLLQLIWGITCNGCGPRQRCKATTTRQQLQLLTEAKCIESEIPTGLLASPPKAPLITLTGSLIDQTTMSRGCAIQRGYVLSRAAVFSLERTLYKQMGLLLPQLVLLCFLPHSETRRVITHFHSCNSWWVAGGAKNILITDLVVILQATENHSNRTR